MGGLVLWAVDFPSVIKADLQVRHLSKKTVTTAGIAGKRVPLPGPVGTRHFRFFEPAAELLFEHAANEWRATRRTGSYVWLTPLNGHLVNTVRVEIPEPDEIERAADELHKIGEPYQGELFGWPCRYRPRREGKLPIVHKDRVQLAQLELGIEGVWTCVCTWVTARAKYPCLWQDDSRLVPAKNGTL